MKEIDFPYSGFTLGWRFEHQNYFLYPNEKLKERESEQLFEDLRVIFNSTINYELFFPESIDGQYFDYTSTDDLINQIETYKREQNDYYIHHIEGYGIVYLPNGERVKQKNLLHLNDFRLRERVYHIDTLKSIWVPISIDKSYEFVWQPELADLNSHRLSDCLKEIYVKLSLPVEPAVGHLDKENPIWIKDFKLFVNPEILERETQGIGLKNIELKKYKITDV